jgi:CarD family transcriptional regulator
MATKAKAKPQAKPKAKAKAKPKAKKLPYAPKDYVVYPTHGVGQVTDVVTEEVAGFELQLYVINFAAEKMTLRVPVGKAQESGLRKISSKDKMQTAVGTLKGRARAKRTMWSRRAQEYEAKINSGDPIAIAEVVRDLHRPPDQPDQSYSERQMYEAAMSRLALELSLVEKIELDAATTKLETMLIKTAPPPAAEAPATPES